MIKPDALQRNLLGEIVGRFEKKGLKIIGMKMMHLNEVVLREHYLKHADKPFFAGIARFMSSAPVIAMVLSGIRAISTVRVLVGPTKGFEAPAGSIRGDLSISGATNLVHASDPAEDPESEVRRFFKEEELFHYKKIDYEFLYGEDER